MGTITRIRQQYFTVILFFSRVQLIASAGSGAKWERTIRRDEQA